MTLFGEIGSPIATSQKDAAALVLFRVMAVSQEHLDLFSSDTCPIAEPDFLDSPEFAIDGTGRVGFETFHFLLFVSLDCALTFLKLGWVLRDVSRDPSRNSVTVTIAEVLISSNPLSLSVWFGTRVTVDMLPSG